MGFIEETGAAQHYRDARILPIYEGTNGIQALDLVGRKVSRDGGAAMMAFTAEISADLEKLGTVESGQVKDAVRALEMATTEIVAHGSDQNWLGAGASAYLELAAMAIGGWMMARSLAEAGGGEGGEARRQAAARHFIRRFCSRAGVLRQIASGGADDMMALAAADF